MTHYVLEACVDSVESALAASQGGATRLELCSNLIIGGTTPDIHLLNQINSLIHIPINILIRPRFGDFLYSPYEFKLIYNEVQNFVKSSANGIVIGCLTPDGQLDTQQMAPLIELAKIHHKTVTLHRAFDMCQDPFTTIDTAISLGIDTILTSGQQNNCIQGKKLLADLIQYAQKRIHILIGAGVNAEVIQKLSQEINATQFHLSGKKIISSKMTFRNPHVSMGLPGFNEYEIFQTDQNEIHKAYQALFTNNL